ncbi:GerAB/ArcD/ProY family transporter [Paenibacillus glycinis]|uniref:Endospore germination permease n=1 Tax=Paenibacillus glycinis TaxID=2697035 RepID=A0ABW9XZ87_9BACL|nr:endospore germination permease [Paenibacillus glycinis]NBD28022.1 endospore germination permease [Paenibacillus glycinis]
MEIYGPNDRISNLELWILMFVFTMGSSLNLQIGYAAGHDSWLSAALGTIAGLGINWIYAFLCQKYPRKSLVEIARILFGPWLGIGVGLLYTWYGVFLGAYVLRNFTDLTGSVLLPRTPSIIVGSIMICVVAWTLFKGVEVICRCAIILLVLTVVSTLLIQLLQIPDMDPTAVLPVLESGWMPILKGAGQIATVTFGETVLFSMLIPYVTRPAAVQKTVLSMVAVVGTFIVVQVLAVILVLGEITSNQLFPSYTALTYIGVGDFIERIEPFGFTVWIFNEFTKLCVCLFATTLAFSQTIGSRDYRFYIIPLGLLILVGSIIIHPNQLDVVAFVKDVWPLYSVPFLILVPLCMLVVALMKRKSWILK